MAHRELVPAYTLSTGDRRAHQLAHRGEVEHVLGDDAQALGIAVLADALHDLHLDDHQLVLAQQRPCRVEGLVPDGDLGGALAVVQRDEGVLATLALLDAQRRHYPRDEEALLAGLDRRQRGLHERRELRGVRCEGVSRDVEPERRLLVREALGCNDMARAAHLLGRPYRMTGRVRRGVQLGRTLGYPTANLALHRKVVPLWGILAVRVSGAGLQDHPAVVSLGTRPTVNGIDPLLEVHLFDYEGDLYGEYLSVDFLRWLRAEEEFGSLDALVVQMGVDSARARAALAEMPLLA